MKKVLLCTFLWFMCLNSNAQGWDFIGWGLMNYIEQQENESMKQYLSPLLESYKGQRVTLTARSNLYKNYNYRTKDTKREIDHDQMDLYNNRKYIIEDVICDVDDWFNMGYLFVLRNDQNEHYYLQIGYKYGLDGLSWNFLETFYSEKFYRRIIHSHIDKFDSKRTLISSAICLKKEKRYSNCYALAEREIINGDTIFWIDFIVGSGREVSSTTNCFLNLKNGKQLRFYDLAAVSRYDAEDDKFVYGVRLQFNPYQFKDFSENSIEDIRLFDIDITNISDFYGTVFQYTCRALYNIR